MSLAKQRCLNVLRFIKKRRMRIITIFIILFISIWYLFHIGIFVISKNSILQYFENNKSNFNTIADYFIENPDKATQWYSFMELQHLDEVGDKTIAKKMMKILIMGNYESIHYTSNYDYVTVEFHIPNLFFSRGKPYAIIYSTAKSDLLRMSLGCQQDSDEAGNYEYKMNYESLGDNWYYVYRER